jgi:hypothetical protein
MTFTASNAVQTIQENLLNSGDGNFNCLVLRAVGPAAPAGLTATAVSTSQINLTWNAATNAAGYNVQRSAINGGPYAVIATGVTTTNYTDTGLTGGSTYYYMVSALNLVGGSANSAQAGTTTLSQPRIVVAAMTGGGLVFSGTNGSPGGGYTVRSSTNLAVPLTNWTPVGGGSFDGLGNYCVTNAINPNEPARFYLLSQP